MGDGLWVGMGILLAAGIPGFAGCDMPPEAAAAPVASPGASHRSDPDSRGVPSFTVVALPDTQYYAASYPEILDAQVSWLIDQAGAGNVAFVLHEGDIVDNDVPRQWQPAAASLHRLDGIVPYVLSAGNHDYVGAGWDASRGTLIDDYFPVSTFARNPWFMGTLDPDHIENNFELFDIPGAGRWLVISLEFGPRDQALAWADAIAKRYAPTPAMVVTHAYLYDDDTRYDHTAATNQTWNPHAYPIAKRPGSVNDGEEIWRKLVVGNSNIRFVFCGHVLGKGVGHLTSVRPDGTTVHQVLANYQMLPQGGGGYLRIMQFYPSLRAVHIQTYSPYLDAFKIDPDNDFSLDY